MIWFVELIVGNNETAIGEKEFASKFRLRPLGSGWRYPRQNKICFKKLAGQPHRASFLKQKTFLQRYLAFNSEAYHSNHYLV